MNDLKKHIQKIGVGLGVAGAAYVVAGAFSNYVGGPILAALVVGSGLVAYSLDTDEQRPERSE